MIQKELGLDRKLVVQYVRYLNDLSPVSVYNTSDPEAYFFFKADRYSGYLRVLTLNDISLILKAPYLGISYQNQRTVFDMIVDVIPATFLLAVTAIAFAFIVGLFIGILCAVWKDSWFDRVSLIISTIGVSMPSFFTAILFGWFFAFVLADVTHLNLTGNIYEIDDLGSGKTLRLKNLILPAVTLGVRPLSIIIQLSRNAMLDVLGQEYIRTARAKGLRFSRIIIPSCLEKLLESCCNSSKRMVCFFNGGSGICGVYFWMERAWDTLSLMH